MSNKASVLLFHISPEKLTPIGNICRDLKLQVIKVEPSSYSQKLGYLAGISGFDKETTTYTGPDFPTEMMVFSGMDSDMVDTFLAKYKEASIPPIGLKAILTAHNIFWSAEQLYKELFKEHMMFTRK